MTWVGWRLQRTETLIAVGAQNALGGFLLAIINGNEAEFLKVQPKAPTQRPSASVPAGEERPLSAAG